MSDVEIPRIERLKSPADIDAEFQRNLTADYARALRGWWPESLRDYLKQRYRTDPAATYAGRTIEHPFGKASGQLSMTSNQIRESSESKLAFVVLKTVIGEDATGFRSMDAWATTDTRMVVEPIVGRTGRSGWTVSWKGRGWGRSFSDYIELCRFGFDEMSRTGMIVAPSAKLHLPARTDEPWRIDEYRHVITNLTHVWQESGIEGPMPLEKDFSPTLAGDDRARHSEIIERWLSEIVPIIRNATDKATAIGLKLMNFVGCAAVQERLLKICTGLPHESQPDFLVYANRLFDPLRNFDGKQGIAYGGPDLSDRNLAILSACRKDVRDSGLELSGTGDIESGRTAVEYALGGCTSIQIHTLFQVPLDYPPETSVSRLRRTLARLIFHPEDGLTAWLLHARQHWGVVDDSGITRWLDLPRHEIRLQSE